MTPSFYGGGVTATLVILRQGPGPSDNHDRGLPTADKHCPLWASRSIDVMHLARRDIAVGTHACLSVCIREGNPSHRCLTLLDQEYTPKCHDDPARAQAPPGRNNLPYGIIHVSEQSTLHQLSALEKLHVSRKAPPPITVIRQDDAWQVGPIPSAGSYEP
jgi:hypothetical protein